MTAPTTAAEKRALLRELLRDKVYPLSFAQERFWFFDQMEPGSALYNIPGALRITGPLDIAALERAIGAVVRRHDTLRTTFQMRAGRLVQCVAPAAEPRSGSSLPVPLPVIDIVDVDDGAAARPDEAASRIAWDESQKAFDLSRGPLFRTALVRLAADDHLLVLTMHHIISDGWSLGVLVRELAEIYQATLRGDGPPHLPELAIQYGDYAAWQRQVLQGNELEAALAHWSQELAGAPAVLALPTDRPRPSTRSHRGGTRAFRLHSSTIADVRAACAREKVTLSTLLLTAFNVLLCRYSGETDLVIGMPAANRDRVELEAMIGLFANTLAIRSDLSGDPTASQLMGRIQETMLRAQTHADLPFEKLVAELRLERVPGASPLFQVMYAMQSAPRDSFALGDATARPVETYLDVAAFDLTLYVVEADGGVACTLEYSTDLFDATTIERIAGHFEVLAAALARHPEQRISQIPLLTAAERDRAVIEWNATAQDYSTDILVHERVRAQARENPDAIAVVFESREVTYRELDTRANQLAHRLQAMGVGPDVLVGVCIERSVEVVVAVLGVLAAGGAYVPLDPEYPEERIARVQADANVLLTIVQPETRAFVSDELPVLELDPSFAAIADEPTSAPTTAMTPDHLAYVLYTSGSTGTPKGVAVSHRAIGNRLLWGMDFHAMKAPDALLQLCAFGFDVSVWEFFTPLVSGARLVMLRPGGHRDVPYLARVMKEQRVNVVCFVPSLLQAFLADPMSAECTDLRHVLCGGEALTPDLRDAFFARLSCDLLNFYGPTEASVDATYWKAQPDTRHIPIGRPIGNFQAYVLDAALEPVPPGVLGDLYLGGVGLARGYLHSPELTAARFLPDPFGPPGSKLYKTGDLARYLEDGNIEFVGRVDHQIKLRGFRIEPAEIEAVLRSHPDLDDAVVLLVADDGERAT